MFTSTSTSTSKAKVLSNGHPHDDVDHWLSSSWADVRRHLDALQLADSQSSLPLGASHRVAHYVSHAKAQLAQSGTIDALVASLRTLSPPSSSRATTAETLLLFKELTSSLPTLPLNQTQPTTHQHNGSPVSRQPNDHHEHGPLRATLPTHETVTERFMTTCPALSIGSRPSWSTRLMVIIDVSLLDVPVPGVLSLFILGHGHTAKSSVPITSTTPATKLTLNLQLAVPFPTSSQPVTNLQPTTGLQLACLFYPATSRSPTLLTAMPLPTPQPRADAFPSSTSHPALHFSATHTTTPAHLTHPIHSASPLSSHHDLAASLTRAWRAYARAHMDRHTTPPVLSHLPLALLLPPCALSGPSAPPQYLPDLLARPILWPTGSLTHAARTIQLLPAAHLARPASVCPPHAALHFGCVGDSPAGIDHAVLLACVARGMRHRAAVLLGAGPTGTQLAVVVFEDDHAGEPQVWRLPVPPADVHWAPEPAPGFAVAVAVTPAGVFAHASSDGHVRDWRIERSGGAWRRVAAGSTTEEAGTPPATVWVKAASPVAVESVVESHVWANQVHGFPPAPGGNARGVEACVRVGVEAWVVEQRGYLELDTAWDLELAHVLTQYLRAKAAGGGYDLTRAVRRTIPLGWMFRGAPHTTVVSLAGLPVVSWAVDAVVRRVMGEWTRHAPAQAMVREADAQARWAAAVVLEDEHGWEGNGVCACWVMVAVATPDPGDTTAATTLDETEAESEGTLSSIVITGHAPFRPAV